MDDYREAALSGASMILRSGIQMLLPTPRPGNEVGAAVVAAGSVLMGDTGLLGR